MNDLMIENTKKTPRINFVKDGYLKITGRSIPEDPSKFYDSILLWLQEYCKNPYNPTKIEIELEYFNSGTSKYLLQMFKELKIIKEHGKNLEIVWYYEAGDDDILERGEYYASILDLEIKYVQVEYE